MPWKEESVLSQKQKFIACYESGKFTKTELCREFGISRVTGDAVIKRYETEGWDALEDKSRAPGRHPNQTKETIEEAVLCLRNKYPRWGARKIRELLFRDEKIENTDIPSEVTVNHILKKHGMVVPRRKGRRRIENQNPYFDPTEPNQIWSCDFKGKFRMQNGQYCNPLTVVDSMSRYIFAIEGLERADKEHSKPVFEKIFRENGLPEQMHSDNGPPFGNAVSLRRMTQLSVWLMEIGVTPVYSDPGHPEQNGRHERMHRELKAECTRPAGKNLKSQQYKFNRFRTEYNNERPHESLGMKMPNEVHKRSIREYPRIIRDWDYERNIRAKMVTVNGAIRWKNDLIMVSSALSGKYIGLEEIDSGVFRVYYRHVALGIFNENTKRIYEIENFNL